MENNKELSETENRAFDDLSSIGCAEAGPIPRTRFARWAKLDQVDLNTLPPVKTWECLKTSENIMIDGNVDKDIWKKAKWSEPFTLIDTAGKVPLDTRIALLWNDEYLYAAYKVEDPDIRAVMTGFNDHIYMHDEDIEIFFEGDGYYYEMGLNAANKGYQLRWTWIERLVKEQRFAELEELFKSPDFLYYVSREGEQIGRHADLNYQLPGVKHVVRVDGTLNSPEIKDKGWTVEIALPWAGLKEIAGTRTVPPKNGESFRMTAYRCHHDRKAKTAKGWTWSQHGNDNIHIPERWNNVVFLDKEV